MVPWGLNGLQFWPIPTSGQCLGSGPNAAPVVSWHTCRKRALTYPGGVGGRLQLSADDAGHPSFTLSPREMIKCTGQPLHPLVLNFIQHPVSLSPKHTLNDLQSQRNELLQLSDTGWAWQVWWSSSENSSPNNLLTRYVGSMCIWGIGYPLVIHWLSIGFWDA